MGLLERRHHLDTLTAYLHDAAAGDGRLVFVSGEAGIGKTALVRHLRDEVGRQARVAIASCDALSTPGPLGPLIHVGPALGLPADLLLRPETTREHLYAQILAALRQPGQPTLLIAEDAHWADEASLNLLRFLGRRIDELSTLLVVTHRDDELGPHHPLRVVIGDLASAPGVRRMALSRLSREAVLGMAEGHAVDATSLYDLTGGNPFFVTEVLAAGGSGTPPTVRDAILARAARLSSDGRRLLDAAAVLGARFDPSLLASVCGGPAEETTEECLSVGIVEHRDGAIAFRHELAREAILHAMSPVRRLILSRRALAAMQEDTRSRHDVARLAHFAESAGDHTAVLTYAVAAAEQAAALGAHREAAAQYARALRCADDLRPERRAELLERRSYECHLTGLIDEALATAEAARALREASGDRLREGDDLRWLSRLHWLSGHNAEAEVAAEGALHILQTLTPGLELALAYSNQAQLRMLAWDADGAIEWGDRAIALAERLGEPEPLVHALNNVGAARLWLDDEGGRQLLERSIAIALGHGFEDHVSRGFANLAWPALFRWQLDAAGSYIDDGIAYTAQHDLFAMGGYLTALRAILRLRRGDWAGAEEDALASCDGESLVQMTRIHALTVLGQLAARRGEVAWPILDEALSLAVRASDLLRRGPVRAARAEAAWLNGDSDRAVAEARTVFDEAIALGDPWLAGELAVLLQRCGQRNVPTDGLATPHALLIGGEWRRAASLWQELGCPLETARALVDGDEAAVREAWAMLDGLGAKPDAAMATRRLRELGAHGLPRGPRSSTRANPASLTDREMEVLALIAEGKPNRTIADRLFLSPKTVAHHVSSILGKLDVPTRADAARRAVELDTLQDRHPPSPR